MKDACKWLYHGMAFKNIFRTFADELWKK